MRITRSLLVRAGLGVLAAGTLTLVATSALVLPRQGANLDVEARHLNDRLAAADRVPAPAPGAAVPYAAALPARTAALLDDMQAAGALDLRYAVEPRSGQGAVAVQRVTVGFTADLDTLARILAGVEGASPAVSVDGMDLERRDGSGIGVTLHLILLGAA
jgi:hypothetical protein